MCYQTRCVLKIGHFHLVWCVCLFCSVIMFLLTLISAYQLHCAQQVSFLVWLFLCLSGCFSVCLSVCLAVSLSVWLFLCLSGCFSVCLAVCLFLCLYRNWKTTRDAESLFLWDSDSNSRVRKCRTPDSDSGNKKPGLRLRLRALNQTPTPTLWLIVWHTDCVLKDHLREILNSSSKKWIWLHTPENYK